MDIFDFLTMIGGLSLFLFGMSIMGEALERRAGDGLRTILSKLTTNKFMGLLTGLMVTAIIQSSSATTVMVVGFVNSGIMTLSQSVNVIMGANIGTTVTAWILSLAGIDSKNVFVRLLKPSSFTPVLALIGIILYTMSKNDKKKDTGMILLGFATLMFGMESMSGAVSGLKEVPEFQQMFLMFSNPILGVMAGAILTAIIQSSSASVGILQALSTTGSVTYGSAVPIIMGQNIGTCVTALISAVGAEKNAKRAALVHLSFNIIGTVFCLALFMIGKAIFQPAILGESANALGIAIVHSLFNVICTVAMFPFSGYLEKLVCVIIPDSKKEDDDKKPNELDDRLLVTPALAIAQSHKVTVEMAEAATGALKDALTSLSNYTPELAESIRRREDKCDYYEDILSTYLIKVSSQRLNGAESEEVTAMLKVIGDYERISDHAVNLLESAEELRSKKQTLSEDAMKEYDVIRGAVKEVLALSESAFIYGNTDDAYKVEPLEEIIDSLKETLRTRHILRMEEGKCSADVGFVWSDILTNLERVSDHCSNISLCALENGVHSMNLHEAQTRIKEEGSAYNSDYQHYLRKYSV